MEQVRLFILLDDLYHQGSIFAVLARDMRAVAEPILVHILFVVFLQRPNFLNELFLLDNLQFKILRIVVSNILQIDIV